jgi:hypothetical protein
MGRLIEADRELEALEESPEDVVRRRGEQLERGRRMSIEGAAGYALSSGTVR